MRGLKVEAERRRDKETGRTLEHGEEHDHGRYRAAPFPEILHSGALTAPPAREPGIRGSLFIAHCGAS